MKKKDKQKAVEAFLAGKEVKTGNDIIKRYVAGETKGRCEWIRYFYSDCKDQSVIRKNCKELFGGRNDDAVGYVGAYTLLRELSRSSVAFWAGFNYSFEQMEANYD
ncbi:MAG: hypothetical protein IJP80_03070 [Bacteroidales bacterium]|nr:hypothetical protein [Bacteroidales bacterium]